MRWSISANAWIHGIACWPAEIWPAAFDDAGLGIQDVADAAVGAGLAQRQEISRMTRTPLGIGARRSSIASPSSPPFAATCASLTASRIAASASASGFGGRLFLRGDALLDAGDGIEHKAGVGIAVALGIFAEEPAAARGLHEGR